MFENKSYVKIKTGSEKSFGFIFCFFFMIIGLYPLLHGDYIRLWACIISVILLFFSILLPKVFILPNKLWLKLDILLGAIVAPIIMGIIFVLEVTPTGIFMRIIGKDILNQKIDKSLKSYWIKKSEYTLK